MEYLPTAATFSSYTHPGLPLRSFSFNLPRWRAVILRKPEIMASYISTKVTANNLSPDHLHYFTQAFNRLVLTDATRHVLAQIIDGKPVREVTYDYTYRYPMSEDSIKPSPESIRAARELQECFRVEMLEIDSDVCLHTNFML